MMAVGISPGNGWGPLAILGSGEHEYVYCSNDSPFSWPMCTYTRHKGCVNTWGSGLSFQNGDTIKVTARWTIALPFYYTRLHCTTLSADSVETGVFRSDGSPKGSLRFFHNGTDLGVAFGNIALPNGSAFYPTIAHDAHLAYWEFVVWPAATFYFASEVAIVFRVVRVKSVPRATKSPTSWQWLEFF